MIINGENFFESFAGVRDVYITGRKGSGKTLLAFAMADYALTNKFVKGVFANIPHNYPVAASVKDAFVIVDESWQFIDNRFTKGTYSFMGAWSRKTNSMWAFPSVFGVDLRVRNLEVERIADLNLLPIRAWLYRWANCWGDKGHFLLVRPEQYFGTYDTKAIPVDDGGAVDSLMALVPEGVKLVQRGGVSTVGKRRNGNGSDSSVMAVDSVATLETLVKRVDELERIVGGLRSLGDGPESIAGTGSARNSTSLRYRG
jgi:hypothetical protein